MSSSSEFTTDITTEEWDVLSEAVGQWESSEDSFLDFLSHLKRIGDPPPEFLEQAPEGFESWWHDFKREMLGREQKSKDVKKERMEQATFIKTKIILKKRAAMDKLTDDLFNAPIEPETPTEPKNTEAPSEPKAEPKETPEPKSETPEKEGFKFQPPPQPKPKQKKSNDSE